MTELNEWQSPTIRGWRWFFLALFVVVAVPIVVYTTVAIRFFNRTATVKTDTYAILNQRYADAADNQKSWAVYMEVRYNLFDPLSESVRDQKAAFVAAMNEAYLQNPDHLADPPEDPFTDERNPWSIPAGHELHPESLAAWQQFRPHLEKVREAAARPWLGAPVTDNIVEEMKFDPSWYQPSTTTLRDRTLLWELYQPTLGTTRMISRLLMFDNDLERAAGNSDLVVANIAAMLGMARQAHREGSLIAQLVGIRIQHDACIELSQLLGDTTPNLSVQQLAQLERACVETSESIRLMDLTTEGLSFNELIERLFTDDGRGNGRITPAGLSGLDDEAVGSVQIELPRAVWPMIAHRFADRAEAVTQFQHMLDEIQRLQETNARDLHRFGPELALTPHSNASGKIVLPAADILFSGWVKALLTHLNADAQLRATITLLALHRHHLARGYFPDTLADLVPEFLDEIPADPFDPGTAIKYRLVDGIPHLYFTGSDGDDDGGRHPAPDTPVQAFLGFVARFGDPSGPKADAADADWVIYPPAPTH